MLKYYYSTDTVGEQNIVITNETKTKAIYIPVYDIIEAARLDWDILESWEDLEEVTNDINKEIISFDINDKNCIFQNLEDTSFGIGVLESYTDKGGIGNTGIFSNVNQALFKAYETWDRLSPREKKEYTKDGSYFHVYSAKVPFWYLVDYYNIWYDGELLPISEYQKETYFDAKEG